MISRYIGRQRFTRTILVPAVAAGLAIGPDALVSASRAQGNPPPPTLELKRSSLTTGKATGKPGGGTFTYQTANLTGGAVATIGSTDATSNPNMIILPDPPNPSPAGKPSQGALGQYTVTYNIGGMAIQNNKNDPFANATFGMSCYYTTLESDWGPVGADTCKSVKIKGMLYKGTTTNPYGYQGEFCASFIAEVRLQGSGVLNSGQDVQYNNGMINNVSMIKAADGTPPVADKTLARSRKVIPKKGVHISLDEIGHDLLANDTGGAIKGYRLDFYKGTGKSVCTNFSNIISVSNFGNFRVIDACAPGQPGCDGNTVSAGE